MKILVSSKALAQKLKEINLDASLVEKPTTNNVLNEIHEV